MSGRQRADGQRGLTCSIARSLVVLGERWSLLIVREAFSGVTRFADFRAALGVAPDVLTERLRTLVETGVLERRPYREPGCRPRHDYHLTPAGRDLLRAAVPVHAATLREVLLDRLTPAEQDALAQTLSRVATGD